MGCSANATLCGNRSSLQAALLDPWDPATWSSRERQWAEEWAERLRDTTQHASDLPLPFDEDKAFRQSLAGRSVRTFHSTRLLQHEIDWIMRDGLVPLSLDLVERKIDGAVESGDISRQEAVILRQHHVWAASEQENREAQVCLSAHPESAFDTDVSNFSWLLGLWGGEGINMHLPAGPLRDRLATLGLPAILEVAVDIADPRHDVFMRVGEGFIGTLLGVEPNGFSVHYADVIPPCQIVAIHQPGSTFYDAHGRLPR